MENVAIQLVKEIQNAGFEAYWAGGCVRDILLGKKPKDYDIVTSAKPDQIKNIVPKTIEVGKVFGVIVAKYKNYNFEIATFRGESEYKDARHPEKIYFTNAKNDAKRRDFTINGMFFDPIDKKIIDYVDGQKDIKEKIIRFIGNPNDRIQEDNLRLLRAIRFKNNLDFKYEKRTWEAVKSNAYRIQSVSSERIAQELNKMFNDKNRANAFMDLSKSGIMQFILPEIEKMKKVPQPDEFHKEGDVFIHTYYALKALPDKSPLTLVWAVILHDSGKPLTITYPKDKNDRIRFNKHVKYSAGIASKIARRLKFPNSERDLMVWLVKNHMIIGDIKKMKTAKRRKLLMDPRFKWLLALHKADALGSSPKDLTLFKNVLKMYQYAKKEHEEEMKKPKFTPLLTGADIIYNLKINEGPKVGKILREVENLQLEEKIKTKEDALDYINRKYKKYNLHT